MKKITKTIAGLGGIVSLGILLHSCSWRVDWFVLFLGIWSMFPFFIQWKLPGYAKENVLAHRVCCGGVSIIVIASLGIYIDAMYIHLDKLNLLFFAFVPLYQQAACFGIIGVIKIVIFFSKADPTETKDKEPKIAPDKLPGDP